VIHSARRRVWITSPYFVPDEGVASALLLAALRGVEVRILIPDMPDHILVYWSAFAYAPAMLNAGIEIHRYHGGFLHQKVFLVDDRGAGVSTANLDNRSFRLNFEMTALVPDPAFASRIESMLLADFDEARRMTREELESMPLWRRVASRAAYLAAPIQ
jgi:cardiolipin synthase